ncbi:MAG: amino acid permease, partial [Dehalococcoidia bacterium]
NTAYNGFPLLAAVLARDGYLPRFFHQRGNRLVFSYGIAALTASAIFLIIAFGASTTRLIPLYALGVFLTFTLAQVGMVKRWLTHKDEGWKRSMTINAIGGFATASVFLIILVTKFTQGGWMVTVAIPLIAFWLYRISGFYRGMNSRLRVQEGAILPIRPEGTSRIPVLVPVEDINLPTLFALSAACARSSDVSAVHIHYDSEDEESDLIQRWERQFPDIPLIVIESPYRTVAEPFSWYVIDRLKEWPNEVTVIVPTIEVRHWWQRPLVNQSLGRLESLIGRRRTVELVAQPFPLD